MQRQLTCIVCPTGCELTITEQNGELIVQGNVCKRGKQYAIDEITNPVRVLTTTVQLDCPDMPLMPVRTDAQIPKDKQLECMNIIKQIKLKPPINRGQIIIENILGLNANIIATSECE